MLILFFLVGVYFVDGLPFFGSTLRDCPNIAAQDGLQINKLMGSWRLAYLFIDEPEDLEEDTTCVVTELMQVNETQFDLLLYMDGRKDEQTIERSTTEFRVTLLTPGQWALHAPLAIHGIIHATVISYSENHMIVTFCATQNLKHDEDSGTNNLDMFNDYDEAQLQRFSRNDQPDAVFRDENQNRIFDLDDLGGRIGRGRYHKRSLKRRRRNLETESKPQADAFHGEIQKFLEEKKGPKREKHLWTAILVKNNNVSALKFVEYASFLMKYGYDVTKGELVSFGKCDVIHK